MKAYLRIAVVVLALSGTSIAQTQESKYDGYWWARQSDNFKIGFIAGYGRAMAWASDDAIFTCLAAKNSGTIPEKYPGDEAVKACTHEALSGYGGLIVGQVQDGIDQFYKDFRNSNIEITKTMLYVRDDLRATKTDKELAEELARFRQAANK